MDKTTITKFYSYQKKSISSGIDDKLLNKKGSLKKAEIVQCTLEKSVDSKSPVSRNTRSSTRARSKAKLTRQSSKINDFFKSQTDTSDETPPVSIPNNSEKEIENKYVPSSFLTSLEKSCDSSKVYDEQERSAPGFITPTKSNPKLSSQKRRFVSLSDSAKTCMSESSTTKDGEKATIIKEKVDPTSQKSRSVRKKLPLSDDDNDETESKVNIKKQKNEEVSDAQNITSCQFWDLSFSPLSKISRPISPLPETPQKLREMRQATSVMPGTSSDKCVVNLNKILELPNSPGMPHTELNITKANLTKSGKLQELQKHLMKMKELKEQKNQKTKAGKSPVKSPVKVTEAESETTNKELPSPNKTAKAPAYERFKHLILPSVPSLILPHSYNVLEDFFKSTDTVVSMMFNRSEVCTLAKVKAAVQEMTKRNFEAKVLGQIKTVYPGAYEFKQEKGLPKSGYKYQGYQLTLTPLFDAVNSKDASEEKMKFTSSDILRRQKIFHSNLVNLVKKKHKVFLQSLNICIPEEKLTRWHPRFRLDEIPEIESSALPEPPYMKIYQTAKDVLEDTKKRLHPKVKIALENVAAASTQQTPVTAITPAANSTKEDLKGIPLGLLERIRAKEAQRLGESITRSPIKDQKKKMLDRLPEISRILRNYFVTEKKPALLFDDLLEKISQSYKSPISKADAENHLKLLLEVAPNWITVANTMKGKYIKMDKTIKLQNIQEKINKYQKNL